MDASVPEGAPSACGGVLLRTARAEDAPALLAVYAPYVRDTAVTFEHDVPPEEDFAGRIAGTLERHPWIVAEFLGKVAGYAYAGPFHPRAAYGWCAETSIYLDAGLRGRGIGTMLYDALERLLFLQGFIHAYACIAVADQEDCRLSNASMRWHAGRGYTTAGMFARCGMKFGRWYGIAWMEKLLAPAAGIPRPVIAFPSLDRKLVEETFAVCAGGNAGPWH